MSRKPLACAQDPRALSMMMRTRPHHSNTMRCALKSSLHFMRAWFVHQAHQNLHPTNSCALEGYQQVLVRTSLRNAPTKVSSPFFMRTTKSPPFSCAQVSDRAHKAHRVAPHLLMPCVPLSRRTTASSPDHEAKCAHHSLLSARRTPFFTTSA